MIGFSSLPNIRNLKQSINMNFRRKWNTWAELGQLTEPFDEYMFSLLSWEALRIRGNERCHLIAYLPASDRSIGPHLPPTSSGNILFSFRRHAASQSESGKDGVLQIETWPILQTTWNTYWRTPVKLQLCPGNKWVERCHLQWGKFNYDIY